jgi:BppU N-terminal domain
MAETFVIKQNDTKTALLVNLIDSKNKPVNLTDCTVRFIMANSTGMLFKRLATIQDTSNGVVLVSFSPEETAKNGQMRAELEVTYPDGKIETFPNNDYINIYIMPDLG